MSWSNATMGFCPNCSLCIESHNGCLHLIHPHFRMVSPYIWTPDFVWPGTRRPNPSWLSASGPWHIFTITPVPRLNDGSLQSLSGEGGEWDDCCKLWIGSFPHGLRSAPVRTTEKRSCHTATVFFFGKPLFFDGIRPKNPSAQRQNHRVHLEHPGTLGLIQGGWPGGSLLRFQGWWTYLPLENKGELQRQVGWRISIEWSLKSFTGNWLQKSVSNKSKHCLPACVTCNYLIPNNPTETSQNQIGYWQLHFDAVKWSITMQNEKWTITSLLL